MINRSFELDSVNSEVLSVACKVLHLLPQGTPTPLLIALPTHPSRTGLAISWTSKVYFSPQAFSFTVFLVWKAFSLDIIIYLLILFKSQPPISPYWEAFHGTETKGPHSARSLLLYFPPLHLCLFAYCLFPPQRYQLQKSSGTISFVHSCFF